jgi:hypothetical protein
MARIDEEINKIANATSKGSSETSGKSDTLGPGWRSGLRNLRWDWLCAPGPADWDTPILGGCRCAPAGHGKWSSARAAYTGSATWIPSRTSHSIL